MTEDQIQALQDENAALKDQLATLQGKLDEMTKKDAEATVEQAAKEGRIGTAPELKAKWVASLIADPNAKDLLLAMAPNPALTGKSAVQAKQAETEKETPETLLAKYNELTDRDERTAFYAKHRSELKRSLG